MPHRLHRPVRRQLSRLAPLFKDAAAFAALVMFIGVFVFLAGTAGEVVAMWRMGGH